VTIEFEAHRGHLRGVAYRMLGSAAEADDAVQEAWLKLSRADAGAIENPRAWLTTVVARVCLDMLRSRTSRREAPLDAAPEPSVASRPTADRELAESVGQALLVVLDKLEPAERTAFVLHDLMAMPFDDIAPIVGRSSAAARQLASRGRRRVQGASAPPVELAIQRRVVDAFIAAMRAGDAEGLVAILDGAATMRMDGGVASAIDGREWMRGAAMFQKAAAHIRPALVDGRVALVVAPPGGQVVRVLAFGYAGAAIREVEIITEPDAIAALAIQDLP
jgi:RNA polymerase sigma-70 factor (ECF subfamily)